MIEPFAVQLYRRHIKGESVQQLALELGISPERIQQRIRAAAAFLRTRKRPAA